MKDFDLGNVFSKIMNLLPFAFLGIVGYLVTQMFQKGVFAGLGSLLFGSNKTVDLGDGKVKIDASLPGATTTPEHAKVLADSFYNALEGWVYDTSALKALYPNLNGNPKLTVQVSNAFGRRPYGILGRPVFSAGTDKTLWEWLNSRLSSIDIRNWRVIFSAAGLV